MNSIFKTLNVHQGEKIPHPNLTLVEGTEISVTDRNGFTLHPIFEDMTDTEVVWSSAAPHIASIDNLGNVTIHKTGYCIIKASNIFHNLEASIILDIKLKANSMGIMFGNQDVISVPISSRFTGEQIPLIITLTPDYAYSEDLIFFSNNPEVAEFERNILHCLKPGKTDIYVESSFNNIRHKFTVIVIDLKNNEDKRNFAIFADYCL